MRTHDYDIWQAKVAVIVGETGEYDPPAALTTLDDVVDFYPINSRQPDGSIGGAEIRATLFGHLNCHVSFTTSWEDAYIASEILNVLRKQRHAEQELEFSNILAQVAPLVVEPPARGSVL